MNITSFVAMAGNRNKAEATQRLLKLGIPPAFIEEEEAAAFYRMSAGAFRQWQKNDPAAPRPRWFGGCKRYKISDLNGTPEPGISPQEANPWDEPVPR